VFRRLTRQTFFESKRDTLPMRLPPPGYAASFSVFVAFVMFVYCEPRFCRRLRKRVSAPMPVVRGLSNYYGNDILRTR
jgi:hypothetical protein